MSANSLNAVQLLIAAGFSASNLTIVTALPSNSPYGTDLFGWTDLDPAMVEVGGNLVLIQACARRLITPRGAQIDDANYGYDIEQWLGADVSAADVAQIQVQIQQELLKDERVLACTAALTFTEDTIVANVQVTGANGPFTFTLTIGELAATIVTG